METYSKNQYNYIATNTTTQVLTGAGVVVGILVGETAAGAITVYDEIGSGTTDVVAVLKASIVEGYYPLNVGVATGIKVVTAGASKITVVYRV